MKLIILAAVIGCCLAAPKREAKSYGGGHHDGVDTVKVGQNAQKHHDGVDHTDVAHQAGPGVPPVIVQERRSLEDIPSYPEFGVKVVQDERTRKVVRSRGRAFDGQNHNFNYVQAPHTVRAYIQPYQQKPVYQQSRDQYVQNQPFYQQQAYQPSGNKFYYPQQQRTDDVAQPVAPVQPAAPAPAEVPVGDAQPPPKPIAILAMNQDVNYDGTFVYDFESENGIRSAVSGSTKRLEGVENPVQVMSGVYSYTSPEGQPVETRWYADETGFHAEGSHLPVAPPVPEAIQRAVEYLKTLPPKEDEIASQPLPASPDVEVSPQRFEQSFVSQQQSYDNAPTYQQQNYNKAPTYQQTYDKAPAFRHQYQRYESYPSQTYN